MVKEKELERVEQDHLRSLETAVETHSNSTDDTFKTDDADEGCINEEGDQKLEDQQYQEVLNKLSVIDIRQAKRRDLKGSKADSSRSVADQEESHSSEESEKEDEVKLKRERDAFYKQVDSEEFF